MPKICLQFKTYPKIKYFLVFNFERAISHNNQILRIL
jgi:hypothetical protein